MQYFNKAEYTIMSQFRSTSSAGGGHAGDRPDGFPKVPIGSVPDDLRPLVARYNRLCACLDILSGQHRAGLLTVPQFHAAARALIWAVLENKDRHAAFSGRTDMSFLLKKLFKQFGILGTTHRLSKNSILSFVAQSTLSAEMIAAFLDQFSDGLDAIQDAKARMWWTVVWIFATTMTNIPATLAWHADFFTWFDWKISGSKSACPPIAEGLDLVLKDIEARTVEFFLAIPEDRAPTEEQVSEACSRLNIQPVQVLQSLEEDQLDDDNVSVVSTASSVRRDDSSDPAARYRHGCASIAQMLALGAEGQGFFRGMTFADLNRLVVALLRRMLRRPKRFRDFNFRLSLKLLRILNQHGKSYGMKLIEIALRICQASGSIALALAWFQSAPKDDSKDVNAVNSAIQAAVVFMRLGNLPVVAGQPHSITPAAAAIFQEAFSGQKMKEPAKLVRTTLDTVKEEILLAREGKWKDPHSAHSHSETPRRPPAAAGGGVQEASSEAPRHTPPAARGGGRGGRTTRGGGRGGSSSGSHHPADPTPVETPQQMIARLQQENAELRRNQSK